MDNAKPATVSSTNQRKTLDRTISRVILVLFLTASIITTTSHNLVNRDLKHKEEKENTLLSVPKPRIREPAKGGLPPIPDFVKKQTAGECFCCIFFFM